MEVLIVGAASSHPIPMEISSQRRAKRGRFAYYGYQSAPCKGS